MRKRRDIDFDWSISSTRKAVPKQQQPLWTFFLCCALLCNHIIKFITTTTKNRKFSTMDVLVPIPMKNAAKCDKQCELQNSANHQIFERKWRQRDILPACLFQCLRGFTLILMWLTCWWAESLLTSLSQSSLMKDARVDLSVQWSGHITRMWFHWKHRIIRILAVPQHYSH